jgi:hypothetical protein
VKGFVGYLLMRTSEGGISITVCQDKAGTDESVNIARDWVQKNASQAHAACPWRIHKLRRDRHLEQAAAMVPPRVVVKYGMGGRRLARTLSRSAPAE